jgi:hypothetical protein
VAYGRRRLRPQGRLLACSRAAASAGSRRARVAPKAGNPGSPIDNLIIDYAVEPDEGDEDLPELVRPLSVTVLGAYRRAVVQRRADELNELVQQYRTERLAAGSPFMIGSIAG